MKKTLYYSFYSVSGWQKPITLTWSLAAVSKSFAIVGRDRLFFNKDFAACKTEIGNSILPNTLNYRLIRPLTLSLLPQLISGCIGYSIITTDITTIGGNGEETTVPIFVENVVQSLKRNSQKFCFPEP